MRNDYAVQIDVISTPDAIEARQSATIYAQMDGVEKMRFLPPDHIDHNWRVLAYHPWPHEVDALESPQLPIGCRLVLARFVSEY